MIKIFKHRIFFYQSYTASKILRSIRIQFNLDSIDFIYITTIMKLE